MSLTQLQKVRRKTIDSLFPNAMPAFAAFDNPMKRIDLRVPVHYRNESQKAKNRFLNRFGGNS